MEKLTWPEANDKIIDAYFKDEIRPYQPKFCFCGTLCNNSNSWRNPAYGGIFCNGSHNNFMHYTGNQYFQMERALLLPLYPVNIFDKQEYEKALFAGMCAALEVLKEIHRNRGENVDEVHVFRKRLLKADTTNQPAITY